MKNRTIRDFGDPVTITEADIKQLGYFDRKTGTIAIRRKQPKAGKHIVLLHEALHFIAEMMRQSGAIKRQPTHAFISGAAPGLLMFLVSAGFWKGLTKRELMAFMRTDRKSGQ